MTDLTLTPAVERDPDGTLRVSSEQIADGSGVQHKNVLELLAANRDDFEAFGTVAFQTRPLPGGGKPVRVALLNEQQATLLMTYQRNTEQVRRFKVALVKAFFEMARAVSAPLTLEARTLAILGELNDVVTRQAAQIEAQAPLVAQAQTYAAGRGKQTRQQFSRDFIPWALAERGVRVKQPEVMEFLGRRLKLFVVGNRSDAGEATIDATARGLAFTKRDTATNGHNFATGLLTPEGAQYAWDRAVRYLDEHGTLVLPLRSIGAIA